MKRPGGRRPGAPKGPGGGRKRPGRTPGPGTGGKPLLPQTKPRPGMPEAGTGTRPRPGGKPVEPEVTPRPGKTPGGKGPGKRPRPEVEPGDAGRPKWPRPGSRDRPGRIPPGTQLPEGLGTLEFDWLRPGILEGAVLGGAADGVSHLSATCPLTLLPVRLETIFDGKTKQTLKVRIYPDEIHVDDHHPDLSTDEEKAGLLFWEKIAGAETEEARAAAEAWLAEVVSEHRAAFVAEATVTGQAATPGERSLRLARAACLPRFWRVVGYRRLANGTLDEAFRTDGVPIPADLCIDPLLGDPSRKEAPAAENTAWMHDFAVARDDMGMAVEIDLAGEGWVRSEGIALLLVYGVGPTASPAEAERLERLITAHRFSDGMSFQAQGVSSNVVEGVTTGVTADPQAPDGSLATVVDRALLAGGGTPGHPAQAPELAVKANGRRLAELWGQDRQGALARIPGADRDEASGPRWMNEALWPVTWGAYFEELLAAHDGTTPVTPETVSFLRGKFLDFVRGGGPLPALRVGRQPYGILPVRAHHVPMAWVDQGPLYEFLLLRLRNHWLAATGDVAKLSPGGNGTREEALSTVLEVLGAVPHPVRMLARGLRDWRETEHDSDVIELLALFGLFFLAGNDPSYGYESRSILGQWGWARAMLTDGVGGQAGAGLSRVELATLERPQTIRDAEDQLDALANLRARLPGLLSGAMLNGTRAWVDYMSRAVEAHVGRMNPVRDMFGPWLASDTMKGVLRHSADDPILAFSLYDEAAREVTQPLTTHVGTGDDDGMAALPSIYLRTIAGTVPSDPDGVLELDRAEGALRPLGGGRGTGGGVFSAGQLSGPVRHTRRSRVAVPTGPVASLVEGGGLTAHLNGTTGLTRPGGGPWRPGGAGPGPIGSGGPDPLLKQLVRAAADRVPAGQRNGFKAALRGLADLPGPTLAWHMRETLGLATNRLDAWLTALATERLEALSPDGRAQIGGYGFVLDLRPDQGTGESSGYIHAPSIQQAATAGILRSAWEGHGEDDESSPLAVNLSAARLRAADRLIQGVSQGLGLGAILGRDFERGLHDAGLDRHLDALRSAVLAAKGEKKAPSGPLDGLDLIEAHGAGELGSVLTATGSDRDTIEDLITGVAAAFDALGDAGLVEATHFLAQGNSARAGAIIDAISLGEAPPSELRHAMTDVAKAELAHNVVLLSSTGKPGKGAGREASHPALDAYVDALLSGHQDVTLDVIDGDLVTPVAVTDLGLSSLDLVMEGGQPGVLGLRAMAWLMAKGVTLSPEARVPSSLTSGAQADSVSPALEAFEEMCATLRDHITTLRPVWPKDFGAIGVDPAEYLQTDAHVALIDATRARLKGYAEAVSDRRRAAREVVAVLLDVAREFMPEALPSPAIFADQESGGFRAFRAAVVAGLERRIAAFDFGEDPVTPETVAARLNAISGGSLPPELSWTIEDAPILSEPEFEAPKPSALADWLGTYAHVRDDLRRLARVRDLAQLLDGSPQPLRVTQLSAGKQKAWLGTSLPAPGAPGGISWVTVEMRAGEAIDNKARLTGYVVDSWVERLPDKAVTTGVAAQFDAPSSRAPQTILIAVTPTPDTGWSDALLARTLIETVENAQLRAVDVPQLEGFGHHLPAIFVEGGIDAGPPTPQPEDTP